MNSQINIAILASGSGTNAENIIRFFQKNSKVNVALLISNKADAKAIVRAKNHNIPVKVINNKDWQDPEKVLPVFEKHKIDFIVLAGFLILVPFWLIRKYNHRIINIHPALLPKYGGKGMYGSKVHEAVISNNESESGITVHYVNKKYDEGDIIFQAKCKVPENRSPEFLAEQIHVLEYEFYPKVIECLVDEKIK